MVSVEMTANAAITVVKFTVGSTTLNISGLSLTTGKKLVIDYLDGKYLRVRENGNSAMNENISATMSVV